MYFDHLVIISVGERSGPFLEQLPSPKIAFCCVWLKFLSGGDLKNCQYFFSVLSPHGEV